MPQTTLGEQAISVVSDTTGNRPATPVAGMQRYNSTTQMMEYFNGSKWVNLPDNIATNIFFHQNLGGL